MKNMRLLSFALVCAMGFGLASCVDDDESASVEAVRTAKAEQLKAKAAYDNAQAEAAVIIAKAEAALNEAKAKAKELQNELAELQLQKAKATLAAEIEAAQARAQAALADAQAQLAEAQARLILAMGQVSEAEAQKVSDLLSQASYVASQLNSAKSSLIFLKSQKLMAENQLVSIQSQKGKEIASNNAEIANKQKLVEFYQQYAEESSLDQYKEWLAEGELYATEQRTVLNKASELYSDAYYAAQDAQDAVDNSVFIYGTDGTDGTVSDPTVGGFFTPNADGVYEMNEDAWTKDLKIKTIEAKAAQNDVDTAQKHLNNKKAEKAYKALTHKLDSLTAAYDTVKTVAGVNRISAEIASTKGDITAYTATEDAALTAAEDAKKAKDEEIEALNTAKANFEEYLTLVEALDKAEEEANAAYEDYQKEYATWQYYQEYVNMMQSVINGTTDFAQLIENTNAEIAQLEKQNSDLSQIEHQEEMVAYYEMQIAQKEVEIAAFQKQYDTLMAEVNKLLEEE